MTEKNIQELEKELERLQKLVFYDELTGLLNRRGFETEALKMFQAISLGGQGAQLRQYRVPFAVLFLDIDNFKHINDSLGHAAGDQVLQHIATLLRTHLRTGDIIGRWGGEEFVAAFLGTPIEATRIVAEKVRAFIEKTPTEVEGTSVSVTASIGIAEYADDQDLFKLVDRADEAMYLAKTTGKNRVVLMDDPALQKLL